MFAVKEFKIYELIIIKFVLRLRKEWTVLFIVVSAVTIEVKSDSLTTM